MAALPSLRRSEKSFGIIHERWVHNMLRVNNLMSTLLKSDDTYKLLIIRTHKYFFLKISCEINPYVHIISIIETHTYKHTYMYERERSRVCAYANNTHIIETFLRTKWSVSLMNMCTQIQLCKLQYSLVCYFFLSFFTLCLSSQEI